MINKDHNKKKNLFFAILLGSPIGVLISTSIWNYPSGLRNNDVFAGLITAGCIFVVWALMTLFDRYDEK